MASGHQMPDGSSPFAAARPGPHGARPGLGRRQALGLGLAALSLAAPRIARGATPVRLRFSHVVAPDTPKGQGAATFARLAQEETGGAVAVEVYPNSTLYKDREELEALQLGAVDMIAPSLAKFGQLGLPEFEIFDLPYLFDGAAELDLLTQGALGAELFGKLEARGITGLAWWDNGFKIMSANRPLILPEDFRGLKMRIQSSRVLDAQMLALGAEPVPLPFSETFRALQTGVADGTENPPSNMFTQHMHRVQPHATLSYHGYLGYAVIVNRAFWQGLDKAHRAGLERALAQASTQANAMARAGNADALAAMQASGATRFHPQSPTERQAWIAALAPVHRALAERLGGDLLARLDRALGR